MAELVNDLQRPLSAPCHVTWLGRACTEEDYKSWRRLAVALRKTLLDGEWSQGSTLLHERKVSWLKKWIDPARSDSFITRSKDTAMAALEADPSVDETERFPRDLKWYQGVYKVYGTEALWTFMARTDALVAYIKSGKQIYDEAVRAGVIKKKAAELEQAEKMDVGPWDYRPWAIRGGVVVVLFGFGVWAYREIMRAAQLGKKVR